MKTFSLTAKLIFSSLFIYGSLIAYSGTIPLKDISKNLSHYTASIPLVNSIENEEEIESEQKQNIQNSLQDQDIFKANFDHDPFVAEMMFSNSHPGSFHYAIAVDFFNKQIELEDRSVWNVLPSDTHKILNWLTSDILVITVNPSWFSQGLYNFQLQNQQTGDSVLVQLSFFLTPFYHTAYNYQILCIDHSNRRIWLNDGSAWDISFWDFSNEWQVGDTIIIGFNDDFFSRKPNILINANLSKSVRAICVRN